MVCVGIPVEHTLRAKSGAPDFCIEPVSMRVVPRNTSILCPVPEYVMIFQGGIFHLVEKSPVK